MLFQRILFCHAGVNDEDYTADKRAHRRCLREVDNRRGVYDHRIIEPLSLLDKPGKDSRHVNLNRRGLRGANVQHVHAGLFAGYPKAWPPGEERSTDFGASFARLAQATGNAASVESRFTTLLTASTDELPVRLRNAVSLLKAKDVPVDWSRLLYDLTRWRSESRWVQRRWARSFWRSQDSEHVEQLSKENSNVG